MAAMLTLILSCFLQFVFTNANIPPGQQFGVHSLTCMERALQRWYVPAAQRFGQFSSFTLAMPSSRQLYDHLFSHTFTSQSFREYCQNYRIGRNEYERCPNSAQKTIILTGHGLADYICIKRVEDFANALPCLQSAVQTSESSCGAQCAQYQQTSRMFLNGQSGSDTRIFMGGDCRYLKCLADCRRPRVTTQCGATAANLIHDALQNAVSSMKTQYETSQPSAIYSFPAECTALSVNPFNPMPTTPQTLPVIRPDFIPAPAPGPVPDPRVVPAGPPPFPTNPNTVDTRRVWSTGSVSLVDLWLVVLMVSCSWMVFILQA